MNTTRKLLYIIAAMLAGIAFMPSCSKEPEPVIAKKSKKSGVKKTGAKDPKTGKQILAETKADNVSPAERHAFTATRNGQHAELKWSIDAGKNKITQINVRRSATGVGNKVVVGELEPNVTSFTDTLPNENAYWYWLRVFTADQKILDIGPVRAGPDKAGSSHYVKLEDKYHVGITRTDELATLTWDFPEDEYKIIDVVRYTHPEPDPFKGRGGVRSVVSTLERKAQHVDVLPNPNTEYWYWFRIILKPGTIIYKGPVKAAYVSASSKKAMKKSPVPATK